MQLAHSHSVLSGVSVSSFLCVAVDVALATEAPTPDLLLLRPHGRGERIITRSMWKHILTQVIMSGSLHLLYCLTIPRLSVSTCSNDYCANGKIWCTIAAQHREHVSSFLRCWSCRIACLT